MSLAGAGVLSCPFRAMTAEGGLGLEQFAFDGFGEVAVVDGEVLT